MTSIAPQALLTVSYPAPTSDDDVEMVRAYQVSGLTASLLARAACDAGVEAHTVLRIVVDAVRTSLRLTSDAEEMLAEADALLLGASLSRTKLAALWEVAESQLSNGDQACTFAALILGYALDVITGRVDACEGAVELVRWVATLAPFVDEAGCTSARGKLLTNALSALRRVQSAQG